LFLGTPSGKSAEGGGREFRELRELREFKVFWQRGNILRFI
jgi:hypothetical protein